MSLFGSRSLWSLALILSAALASSAAELSSGEAAAVLKRLQELRAKEPSLTADFSEEKASRLLAKPLVTRGSISFQAPNLFRREVKGSNPSLTISNGRQLWIYYPNFKEAELYVLGQRSFFDESIAALTAGLNFHNVEEHYAIKVFREPPGYRFVLTPKSSTVRRMVRQLQVFLDDDFRIQRTDAALSKNDRLITTYNNVRRANLPASAFEFTPPPGVRVTQPLGK